MPPWTMRPNRRSGTIVPLPRAALGNKTASCSAAVELAPGSSELAIKTIDGIPLYDGSWTPLLAYPSP